MSAEFDDYAGDYESLLKDPIRDIFAQSSAFFHLRKWLLLRDHFRRERIPTKNLHWLDVGCGKGELLHFGQRSFGEAIGCDPSLAMLEECGGIRVTHQPDPSSLPFPENRFDLVTAVCVYHHLTSEQQTALTREAFRILKPGGFFAIFEHNPWNPATRTIVSRTPVDANAVLLTAGQVRRLMAIAGLSPERTSFYLYFPQRLYSLFGWLEPLLAPVPLGGQYAVFGRR